MANTNYINNIMTYFRNLSLNAMGVERDIYRLLQDKDISKEVEMMQNNDEEVEKAISEYNVQTHKVMYRINKSRKNTSDYIVEKLPRNRAQYINEVELFFLFGNPVKFEKMEGTDKAFGIFKKFLHDYDFNGKIKKYIFKK